MYPVNKLSLSALLLAGLSFAILSGTFASGVLADVGTPAPTAASNDAHGLSLPEAIEQAKAQSPAFRKAKASEQEASWKRLEALSGILPKITMSANHLFDVKYQILNVNFAGQAIAFPEVYPETTVEADANWTVFDGLRSVFAWNAAKLNHQATELELSRAELSVETEISQRYYQALAAQALEDVAEENVKSLQDHLANTKDVLKQGAATRFDLLRVQVQLEEAVPDLQSAKDNVLLARRALSEAMGTPDDSRPLTGELPVPAERELPSDPKAALAARDDVQAMVKRAEAADNMHSAAFGAWIPAVSFFGQKQWYNNTNFSLSNNFGDAYAVGIALSWNIFDGGASIAKRSEAAAQREQAQAQAEALTLAAPNELELWRRKFLSNLQLYRARRRAVEAAQESVRLAKLGFQAGTRTNTDVLDAELDLFRARAGIVRAQLESEEAILNLELASGKRIQ